MSNPAAHEAVRKSGATTKSLVAKAQRAWNDGDEEKALFLSQQAHAYAIGSLLQHAPELGDIAEGASNDVAKALRGALRPLDEALKHSR